MIIKDEEKTLTKKYLEYEVYEVDENNPIIKGYINETLSNFDGDPQSIKVIITLLIE